MHDSMAWSIPASTWNFTDSEYPHTTAEAGRYGLADVDSRPTRR
ncbi:hypothetical protein I552_2060 [Mycobacterium xenopi 3993]|nr:hypothetical protein I552_2060 [Mycobacterium xenopi 3993]